MLRFRRRLRAGNKTIKKASYSSVPQVVEKAPAINNPSNTYETARQHILDFSIHMSKYIGQTVTVFVSSGGMSGIGFTGILMSANEIFIRLIIRIGPAPSCPLGSSCSSLHYMYSGGSIPVIVTSLGSVADIPVDKIASFVHNAV